MIPRGGAKRWHIGARQKGDGAVAPAVSDDAVASTIGDR